ncbi:hypothetical protein X011_17730 [Mycobacterium tuberculosis variant microti OV254]|nr:hypothetical protein X011_17730 [Mycobacterium tuberculosis variant microti OV254]
MCDELQVIAREEPIWAWATGMTSRLSAYAPNYAFARPFMTYVRNLGFEYGIESLEGPEGCLATVGRLCLTLASETTEFVLATEDTGELPLRPTMEQIATLAGWALLDARAALDHLDLGALLT